MTLVMCIFWIFKKQRISLTACLVKTMSNQLKNMGFTNKYVYIMFILLFMFMFTFTEMYTEKIFPEIIFVQIYIIYIVFAKHFEFFDLPRKIILVYKGMSERVKIRNKDKLLK